MPAVVGQAIGYRAVSALGEVHRSWLRNYNCNALGKCIATGYDAATANKGYGRMGP